MADDRRGRRSAPQVDIAPECAEQAGRDRRVDALQQMPGAEADARHRQPDDRAAEPHLEPVQQERALDLLAQAARHQHDEREEPRVARRAQQILQRVFRHGVERRRHAADRENHGAREQQRHERERQPEDDFRCDAAPAKQHVARPLAVRQEQPDDQQHQQERITDRERDDVRDVEAGADVRAHAERRQRAANRDLRDEVGAEDDFEDGDNAMADGGWMMADGRWLMVGQRSGILP